MCMRNFKSCKLRTLLREIEKENYSAIEEFWSDIERIGAPLVEEIEGDNSSVLVTFLYRAAENIENILIYGEVLGFRYSENIMEYDDEPIIMEVINNMRDVLLNKGYSVAYKNFPSGHDYLAWGETLATGLIALIGM